MSTPNGKPVKITIDLESPIDIINPNLYGHFSEHLGKCIYEGYWVGEDSAIPNINGIRKDVVEALREIKVPVLRWPGGCFADDYHWRDGIGPREDRPIKVNRWWNSLESNEFGTHEFLELCKLLDCDPYICGNLGSGTIKEMKDWWEYLNCDQPTTLVKERIKNGHPDPYYIPYWGIGNENWGCGGNMSPQYYANEYRRYQTYIMPYDKEHKFQKIACGASGFDYNWTDKFLGMVSGQLCQCNSTISEVHGLAFHYYCGMRGHAVNFTEKDWYIHIMKALAMEELIEEHRKIMDKYDKDRKIDLICDEWGTWHAEMEGTPKQWLIQQNTIRDAIIASSTLDIFNNHCDKIKMANIAQTVNVLQAMILTDKEKMIKTPTFYVYKLYAQHQGKQAFKTTVDCEEISAFQIPLISASSSCTLNKEGKENELTLTLSNLSTDVPASVNIKIPGYENRIKEWQFLTGESYNSHNTFENPEKINLMDKKPNDIENMSDSLEIPPHSVNRIISSLKKRL